MFSRLLGLLFGLLFVCVSLLARPAHAESPLAHERFALDNGLDVVLIPDRRTPLVAINLTYHVGSMHDGDTPGLAHLVEHLMFRGSQNIEDGEHHAALLSLGAIDVNATTARNHTSYTCVIPPRALGIALWLESERMGWLRAQRIRRVVETEKGTTTDEWERHALGNRIGIDRQHLWRALYPPGHPFSSENPETIARLTHRDTKAFVREYYGPRNATLVVAGDLPADVRPMIERAFAENRGGGAPPTIALPPRPAPSTQQRLDVRSPLATTPIVVVAWPTPGLFEPGDAEADAIMHYLDTGWLRERLDATVAGGLVGVDVFQDSGFGESLFAIVAEGNPSADPEQMLSAIDDALGQLRRQPPGEAQVRRAARTLATNTLERLQSVSGRADAATMYLTSGHDPDWLDADIGRYEALDPAAVADFMSRYLDDARRIVLLARPGTKAR